MCVLSKVLLLEEGKRNHTVDIFVLNLQRNLANQRIVSPVYIDSDRTVLWLNCLVFASYKWLVVLHSETVSILHRISYGF